MVSLDVWVAFIAAACVLNFMPGPSMLLVIAQAVSKSARASIGTIAGIVVGDALLIVLSLFGVGALLAASAELFILVKWLGALYLVYLGLTQWRSRPAPLALEVRPRGLDVAGFRQGVVVTLLNPKVIAFNIAFFPQFIDGEAPLAPQMLLLGATFLLLAALAMAFYAVAADRLRRLSGNLASARLFNKVSGCVLIGSGLFMATLKRS